MAKKILLMVFISILFLSSCKDSWKDREYSFTEGFADLAELDAKYKVSFSTEQLNYSMVTLEDVEPFIVDLNEFRENVKKTKDSPDKEALIDFVAVRITMILAEKNFQLAQNIGDIGSAMDGFSCSEVNYLLEASYYYNKTVAYTVKARSDLDTVLYKYRAIPELQQRIGIGENKTLFYYFHLDNVRNILIANEKAVTEICKATVVKN